MCPKTPQNYDLVQFAPNVAVEEEPFEKPEDSPLGLAKDGLVDVVDGFEDVDADLQFDREPCPLRRCRRRR